MTQQFAVHSPTQADNSVGSTGADHRCRSQSPRAHRRNGPGPGDQRDSTGTVGAANAWPGDLDASARQGRTAHVRTSADMSVKNNASPQWPTSIDLQSAMPSARGAKLNYVPQAPDIHADSSGFRAQCGVDGAVRVIVGRSCPAGGSSGGWRPSGPWPCAGRGSHSSSRAQRLRRLIQALVRSMTRQRGRDGKGAAGGRVPVDDFDGDAEFALCPGRPVFDQWAAVTLHASVRKKATGHRREDGGRQPGARLSGVRRIAGGPTKATGLIVALEYVPAWQSRFV
jgi:hypothetical protein